MNFFLMSRDNGTHHGGHSHFGNGTNSGHSSLGSAMHGGHSKGPHGGHQTSHSLPAEVMSIFIGAETAAAISFMLVLLTVFLSSKVVKRTTVWVNFCLTWLVFSLSFLLPFIDLHNDDLCAAAAVLRFGTIPLVAFATLSLNIETWMAVVMPNRITMWKTFALVAIPHVLTVIVMVGGIAALAANDGALERVCLIDPGFSTKAILLAPPMAISLIFQGLSMWHLYSRRFTLDKLDGARTSATVDVMFRMAAFSVVIIVLFVAAAVDAGSYAAGDQSGQTDDDDVSFLLIAAIPLTVVLIFGTKPDILRAWMFWRQPSAPPTPAKDSAPASPASEMGSIVIARKSMEKVHDMV